MDAWTTRGIAGLVRRRWLLIVGASAVIFGPGLCQLAWLSWQEHVMERRLRTLQAAQEALVKEHQRLQSDRVYVEGLIRSTFKMAKPGELVVPRESLGEDRRQP